MPYPLRSTNVCFSCPLVLTPCEGPNSPIPAMAWFMRGALVGLLVWRLASLQWRISQSLPTRGLLSTATSKSWVIRVFSIRGPRDLKQILLAYTPSIQHSKSWDALQVQPRASHAAVEVGILGAGPGLSDERIWQIDGAGLSVYAEVTQFTKETVFTNSCFFLMHKREGICESAQVAALEWD